MGRDQRRGGNISVALSQVARRFTSPTRGLLSLVLDLGKTVQFSTDALVLSYPWDKL